MTEVKFFFNVEQKMQFACKLAKAAVDGRRKLVVFAPLPGQAEEFDRLLWTFQPLSFVPHVPQSHALAASTPVVVAVADAAFPFYDALLNLSDDPPPFFTRFEALREVVSTDEEDRSRARERLKFYKARGFEVQMQDNAKQPNPSTNRE